jgi:hypothetical protein
MYSISPNDVAHARLDGQMKNFSRTLLCGCLIAAISTEVGRSADLTKLSPHSWLCALALPPLTSTVATCLADRLWVS